MSGRTSPGRIERGPLTALERLAPRPPQRRIAERIERHTAPGDIVLDLHGRGGWIARAALARGRRAISLEEGPLTQLLAEIVLRPPDAHHLDAAFDGLAAAQVGGADLPRAIGALFASTCPACGSSVVAESFTWILVRDETDEVAKLASKDFRCDCSEDAQPDAARRAPTDDTDVRHAAGIEDGAAIKASLRSRFPVPEGAETLVDDLLGLHTPRQLAALGWIVGCIEGDLRAEPIEAALRLALLDAVLPASRLARSGGRPGLLRVANGRVRVPSGTVWLERNPWLAFEDGFRAVRAFVEQLADRPGAGDTAADGRDAPPRAAIVAELRALADGPATALVRVASPRGLRAFAAEAAEVARRDPAARIGLAIGQPPRRPDPVRLALAWHGTAWALGREAAASLPVESLLGPAFRAPWDWQAAALRRTLDAVAPLLDEEGRVVLLIENAGPEALAAAALGAAGAGYRLGAAQVGAAGDRVVELVPPGASPPPGPRTRANVSLPAVAGAAGDPELVPGPGLFSPPERVNARPFSSIDAARRVTETAVAALATRGEPASFDALFAEVLVGLDRAGQLRRLAASWPAELDDERDDEAPERSTDADEDASGQPNPTPVEAATDQVGRLIAVIREELTRPTQRRLHEVAPDRWWLRDPADRDEAAVPLADRVEWATYSLLATGTAISESRFRERINALFGGPDQPDPALVEAAVASYRSPAGPAGMLITADDLVRRSYEHTELVGALIGAGHKLGMRVWVAPREQDRRVGGTALGDRLSDQEQDVYLPLVTRGPGDALEPTDVIWYVRGKATFLIEVEWTAMIGDLVLRRHARIPQDDRLVRLLVIPPERSNLVRHKLERSVPLQEAFEAGNWHVLKWNHLATFLARDPLDLGALEPFLGFDPVIEKTGEQLPLFGGER